MAEITPEMIDHAAKYLRETQQAGKRLNAWETLPKSSKKKWLDLAEGTLRAASLVEEELEQLHRDAGEGKIPGLYVVQFSDGTWAYSNFKSVDEFIAGRAALGEVEDG